MKVYLERKLESCPKKLVCTVCQQWFEVGKIRTLLYNRKGLILGDVCPSCLKLQAVEIRTTMRDQACSLLQQQETLDLSADNRNAIVRRDRALELLEASQEEVQFPSWLQWWLKKFEVFSIESQELEAARFGMTECYCAERSRLQKMLEDDRDG